MVKFYIMCTKYLVFYRSWSPVILHWWAGYGMYPSQAVSSNRWVGHSLCKWWKSIVLAAVHVYKLPCLPESYMWYPVFTYTDTDACVHHMRAQYSMPSVTDTVEWVPKTVRMMMRLATNSLSNSNMRYKGLSFIQWWRTKVFELH